MEWIILFGISWLLGILLIEWRNLKTNIWCGIIAAIMQIFIDNQFIAHNLYIINKTIINIFGSSLFFAFGPVFVIGVLLAQYHPIKKWAIIVHVIIITSLFSFEEYFLLKSKVLVYTNWNFIDSVLINILAISLLSWISIVVFDKRKELKG